MGTFRIGMNMTLNLPKMVKTGGNVVAYFCTPDLTILHAVWGPESPEQFLAEARWAVDLGEKLRNASAPDRVAIARTAHAENPYRMSKGMWQQEGMDHYTRYGHLMEKVLQPLTRATGEELFLKLVNETPSEDPVRVSDGIDLFGPPIPSCRPRP